MRSAFFRIWSNLHTGSPVGASERMVMAFGRYHRLLILGLFFFLPKLVFGQFAGSRELDSLILLHKSMKESDSEKYRLSIRIAELCADLSPHSGVKYAEAAIDLAKSDPQKKAGAFVFKALNLIKDQKAEFAAAWVNEAEVICSNKDWPVYADLLNLKGHQQVQKGNRTEAENLFKEAIKLAEKRANYNQSGRLYADMGQFFLQKEDTVNAMKFYKKSNAAFSGIMESHGILKSNIGISETAIKAGNTELSIRVSDQVVQLAALTGHYTYEAMGSLNTGRAYNQSFQFIKSVKAFNQAIMLGEKYMLRDILSSAYGSLSSAYIAQGKYDLAIQCDQKVVNLELNHNKLKAGKSYVDIARSFTLLTRNKEAINAIDSAIDIFRTSEEVNGLSDAFAQKTFTLMRMSDFNKALETSRLLYRLIEKHGEKETDAGRQYVLLSILYQQVGKIDSAEIFAERAIRITEETADAEGQRMAYGAMQSLYYVKGDRVKEEIYLLKAYRASQAQQNVNAIKVNLAKLGNFYSNQGKFKEALIYYDSALILALESGDMFSASSCYRNKAMVFRNLGSYDRAINLVHQSMAINQKSGNKNLLKDYDFLGAIYDAMMDYPKALECYEKALKGYEDAGNKRDMAVSHMLKGKTLGSMQKYSEAFVELETARKMFEDQKSMQVQQVMEEVIVLNLKQQETLKAALNIEKAMELALKNSNIPVSSRLLSLQAELSGQRGKYHEGLRYVHEAIDRNRKEGFMNSMMVNVKMKSNLYEKAGKYDSAYYSYLEYIVLRDSIHNIDTRNAITRKELQFEYDKKESEFLLNEKLANERIRNSEQELELSKKQILLTQTQLALKNKDLDLQKLAYLRAQAELNNQKISAEKQKIENQIKEARINLFAKQNELQKNLLSARKTERNALMAGIVLIGLLLFFVSLNYYNQRISNRTIQRKNTELKNTLDHLEKTQEQLIASEKQKNLEIEKSRIARDMHDEIGSGLTKISLLSEVLKSREGGNRAQVEAISKTAGELVDNMSQIIWAMNPATNKLENLFGYLRKYSMDFFENTPIKCSINVPETTADIPLNQFVKRNLFLVIKESLNNIVKHAEATLVVINAEIMDDELQIRITDNGKGFDVNKAKSMGNGLNNLQRRMEEIGGEFRVESTPGKGTETNLFYHIESSKHLITAI